ncbi:uncharacterized protein ATNIH1004_000247 [Aspergillus tanneri]|uniref:Uncharacterized protein n=1 Tax=Aspergillus tanneri TaxID=1220188 RepID=A0A5M9MW84_9EURO|nr:uncharacterized protein ATNIH1004_000247 [Aspergillus tanneri]KAA8651365.1 hypothetical protein ATNIH1004_000247 [Aspergillus tanneri]
MSYKGGTATFSYQIGVADRLVAMAVLGNVKRPFERHRELERLSNLPSIDGEAGNDDSSDGDSNRGDFLNSLEPMDINYGNLQSPWISTQVPAKSDFNETDESVIDLTGDINNTTFLPPMNHERQCQRNRQQDRQKPRHLSRARTCKVLLGNQRRSWLVLFRATSEQGADDFLKENNIKLRHRMTHRVAARDYYAYQQGWKDSENIDFRQRRLESQLFDSLWKDWRPDPMEVCLRWIMV